MGDLAAAVSSSEGYTGFAPAAFYWFLVVAMGILFLLVLVSDVTEWQGNWMFSSEQAAVHPKM